MKQTMKSYLIILLMLLFNVGCTNQKYPEAKETVIISGKVTDFNNQPIDSSVVQLMGVDFNPLYEVYTDENGDYSMEVEKGNYLAMFAMRLKEYPRENAVPESDMRLEFWGWNIIADRDLVINPRYDRLELYGTTVFRTFGAYNGFFVYFRPMSLIKYLSYSKEMYLDKEAMEKKADISVKKEHLRIKVYADDEALKINSVQTIEEFVGANTMTGYVVQVDAPTKETDRPYIIFRIEAENVEYPEAGENIYFYEKKSFK